MDYKGIVEVIQAGFPQEGYEFPFSEALMIMRNIGLLMLLVWFILKTWSKYADLNKQFKANVQWLREYEQRCNSCPMSEKKEGDPGNDKA